MKGYGEYLAQKSVSLEDYIFRSSTQQVMHCSKFHYDRVYRTVTNITTKYFLSLAILKCWLVDGRGPIQSSEVYHAFCLSFPNHFVMAILSRIAYKIAPMLNPLGQCCILSLINTDVTFQCSKHFWFSLPDQSEGSRVQIKSVDILCILTSYVHIQWHVVFVVGIFTST